MNRIKRSEDEKDQMLSGVMFSVLESSALRLLITSSLIAEMDECIYLDVLSLEASVSGVCRSRDNCYF